MSALTRGCATVREASRPLLPAGSTRRLDRELVAPERRWSAYSQHGHAERLGEIDDARSRCELKVHGPKAAPQTIHPATFTVTHAEQRPDRTASREIRFASRGSMAAPAFERRYGHDISDISPAGADSVHAFTCTVPQEAGLGRYMTLTEARTVVGDTLSLRPVSTIGVE
ncbi:hypothetical protein SADO_02835 [Salinisphaera dokdonensis CL-ES53]|uniref:Uncharacterized protein n=1 Tax=Salinisphaera dokdonensis CL-ES53 TaxID=1304272 RepID=A0ABV2AWX9_9GAMM